MKIGIASYAYIDPYGYEKGIEKLKRHGYDCVDYNCNIFPNLVDTEHKIFSLSDAELERKLTYERKLYKNAGIFINQTHGPWRYPPRDNTKEDRAERFEKMCRSVLG